MASYGPIDRRTHAYLDFLIFLSGFLAPWTLGFSHHIGATLYTFLLAILGLGLGLVTDYPLGVWRRVPFRWHQIAELLAPLAFIFTPWLFFTHAGLMPWYLSIVGCAILLNTALTGSRGDGRPEAAH